MLLNANNSVIINAKLKAVSNEINNLKAKIEYLKSQVEYNLNTYERAPKIAMALTKIRHQIRLQPENSELLRQSLIMNIEKITSLGNKEYLYYFNYGLGSSKEREWGE